MRPVILIGDGGHARVVADVVRAMDYPILGCTGTTEDGPPWSAQDKIPYLGGDDAILAHSPGEVLLIVAFGSLKASSHRKKVHDDLRARGYTFLTLRHPSSIVSPSAHIGEGAQIMAGAIIQAGAEIGENAIVNTGARIDHDSHIGPHAHVAPGVLIAGFVNIGESAHIGSGAIVIQRLRVGPLATVAAGAVVIADVPSGATVSGVPALAHGTT